MIKVMTMDQAAHAEFLAQLNEAITALRAWREDPRALGTVDELEQLLREALRIKAQAQRRRPGALVVTAKDRRSFHR